MKIVYKYTLEIGVVTTIRLPIYSKVVGFRLQRGIPTVWIVIDLDEKVHEKRDFFGIPTGWQFNREVLETYGTVEDSVGLIWHLVEVSRNENV